jgi:hypothetical protein
MMSLTCLNFWGTKFGPWMDARLEKNSDFTRFGGKININRNIVGILPNFADPLYVFLLRCLQKISSKFDFSAYVLMFSFLEFLTRQKFMFNSTLVGKFKFFVGDVDFMS